MTKETLLTFGFVDNEYLDKYLEIVNHNDNDEYTEKHHIIPRSFYAHRDAEVDNSENNLVSLNYRNHILAHYYACFCTTEKDRQSMIFSFWSMTNIGYKKFNIDMISELERAQELRNEFASRISEAEKGKTVTEETRELIRSYAYDENGNSLRSGENNHFYNMHHSDKTKEVLREHRLGSHFYNNGKEMIQLKDTDEVPEGFVSGKLEKFSKPTSNKIWYTNGEKNIYVNSIDEVPEGFYQSRIIKIDRVKGDGSNVGVLSIISRKHMSEEARKNISKSRTGKESSIKGRICITNGVHNLYVNATDEIPFGYWKGMTRNNKKGVA